MSKLLGMILILTSCIFTAYIPIITMKQRMHFLSAFEKSLLQMSAELRLNLLPIPELMEIVGADSDDCVKPLFNDISESYFVNGPTGFQSSWYDSITRNCPMLTSEEQQCLCNVGQILGRFTLEDELVALERAAARLHEGYVETRNGYRASKKLFMSCGTVIGMIIAIALL